MDSSESKSEMIPSKPQNEQSELYSEIANSFMEANLRKFYEGYQQSQVLYPNVGETNETSLERMERKLDELRRVVATREDIFNQTQLLLNEQERISVNLREKLDILRSMQESNVPHKRLAKYSLAFFLFFALSFLSRIILGVIIITPLWTNIGLLFSFGFLVIAFAMSIDWKENIKKG